MTGRAANDDERAYAAAAEQMLEQDKPASAVPVLDSLGAHLIGEFRDAEIKRRSTEERWLEDLRQYRGQYDPAVLARIGANRSKAFVRKTRVKVKTTDSRVADLLFPAGTEKNWDITPTPKPSLSADQKVEIRKQLAILQQQAAQAAQQSQAQSAQAGATMAQTPVAQVTRSMFDQAVQEWAKTRCKAMSRTIDDQLSEARYKQVSIKAIHSGHLYGTGIVKGPLVERKVRTRFIKEGNKWVPQVESYVVPFIDYVPLWRFYPDMAATELENCRFVYERHLMSKSEMAELAKRASFNKERIVAYVLANIKGQAKVTTFDLELTQIGGRTESQSDIGGKYEVLERWGYLDGQQLRDASVEVPDDRLHESFFANVWLLPSGEIIKATLQPINGVTWPYHIYYFDKDESSIFGEGLSAIMRDDQSMINASTRLMIDNAAITSGPQIEIIPSLLHSVDNVSEFSPWKVWHRNGQSPGSPAIRAITFESRIDQLSAMTQIFETNSDETTAIPRYMSGDNATTGAAGTSSGLSMLMGSANIVIKDLINAWDEGITRPFITALYCWNMQFNPDDEIKGDFDVAARGTASLVAKEVRANALNQFAQLTTDPLDAPYIKRDVLNRQRAEALELTDVVKTEDEVKADQQNPQIMKQVQLQQAMGDAQLAKMQADVAKVTADAQHAQGKLKELLANIDLIIAKTVETKVETAYSALQAGGVATNSPFIAPAGDEILKSAGYVDKTPNVPLAALDGPPVQPTQGVDHFMPKGATFQEEPRVGPGGQPEHPQPPSADPADQGAVPQPATGMVGKEAGIETPAVG